MTTNNEKNWFALYVKPRHEFKAEMQIASLDIQQYLPYITEVRQWSDRKRKVKSPLLTGYIFIYGTEKERLIALETPSVVRCVCERGKPAIIPEHQMHNLMSFVREEHSYSVYNGIVRGTKVLIKQGPFQGVTAVVVEDSDGKSLAVSVDLLNRSIITHISDPDIVQILR